MNAHDEETPVEILEISITELRKYGLDEPIINLLVGIISPLTTPETPYPTIGKLFEFDEQFIRVGLGKMFFTRLTEAFFLMMRDKIRKKL